MLFPDGADGEVARGNVIETLRPVALLAEELGVTLCLEPVNRFETYVLNTAEQGAALIDAIGSRSVAVQLDTFHMNIEEGDGAASIRALGPRLGHFQVADNDRSVPGNGSIDFAALGEALDDIDYGGWISLETFPHPGTQVGNDTFTWRPLVTDHHHDAVTALALIRDCLGGHGDRSGSP
jgi:D-psicose/D-tagatose/L-ribulose 3-epimerase